MSKPYKWKNYELELELQEDISNVFRKLGYKTFKEPLTGCEPDIMAIKNREVLIIEVKLNVPIDAQIMDQMIKYDERLRPLFGSLGVKVRILLAGISKPTTQYQEELIWKLKQRNVEVMTIDNLENLLAHK